MLVLFLRVCLIFKQPHPHDLSALVILFSLVVLLIVRRNITRRVNHLIERIREIRRGRWEQRVDIVDHDEVSSLAKEFNLMSEELARSYSQLTEGLQEKLDLERERSYRSSGAIPG